MTYAEYISWCRYRNKYGGLHHGMRFDRGLARLIAHFAGGSPMEFSPMDRAIKESQAAEPGSVEEAFALLNQVSKSRH